MGIFKLLDKDHNLIWEQQNTITEVGYELQAARLAWVGLTGGGGITSLPQIQGINAVLVGSQTGTAAAWTPAQSVSTITGSPLYIFPLTNITMSYTATTGGNVSTVYTGIIQLPTSVTDYIFNEIGLISLFDPLSIDSRGVAASSYTALSSHVLDAGAFPLISGDYSSSYIMYAIVERGTNGNVAVSSTTPSYFLNWTFQNNFVTGT